MSNEDFDNKWHTCWVCGYDDRTKTDKNKYCMSGICNVCRKKRDREYDFKQGQEHGSCTRDDEIMCPYCGYVQDQDVFEMHDSTSFTCPECDKESDLDKEYTTHFTTTKRDDAK